MLPTMSLNKARKRLESRGFVVIGLGFGSMTLTSKVGQVVVADYSRLPGYSVKLAIAVYDARDNLVDRFNVSR